MEIHAKGERGPVLRRGMAATASEDNAGLAVQQAWPSTSCLQVGRVHWHCVSQCIALRSQSPEMQTMGGRADCRGLSGISSRTEMPGGFHVQLAHLQLGLHGCETEILGCYLGEEDSYAHLNAAWSPAGTAAIFSHKSKSTSIWQFSFPFGSHQSAANSTVARHTTSLPVPGQCLGAGSMLLGLGWHSVGLCRLQRQARNNVVPY